MKGKLLFFPILLIAFMLSAVVLSAHTAPIGMRHSRALFTTNDSLSADSAIAKMPPANAPTDSVKTDTIRRRKAGIDSPVEYTANDSLVYEVGTNFAYLFGQANVNYQGMKIDAAKLSMSMDSSMVHAEGYRDTVKNVLLETPIFRQGSEEYKSEKMSFNFKTQKGYITNVSTAQGNGFLKSNEAKRGDDGTLYFKDGKYTTCDAEHPHFYVH